MNEESKNHQLIRLRNYGAIKVGEEAAQMVVEKNWGSIPIDEYWRVFHEAYDIYIKNHPIEERINMENIAFLTSEEAKKAKHAVGFRNDGIFIISDNSASQGLKWAAENRMPSLAVCFDKFEKEEGLLIYNKVACLKTHVIAENVILKFLKDCNIGNVILDGFHRELSAEFKKALSMSSIHFINF